MLVVGSWWLAKITSPRSRAQDHEPKITNQRQRHLPQLIVHWFWPKANDQRPGKAVSSRVTQRSDRNDFRYSTQVQRCRPNESLGQKGARDRGPGIERRGCLIRGKLTDILSHEAFAKIVVGSKIARGNPSHAGVSGQVHGIGDDGGGGI